MVKFSTKGEVESKTPAKKTKHYVGEIFPEIFSGTKASELNEKMPLDAAIIWLGAFRFKNGLFPKEICPACGKETLIPYKCGGSILSGAHTIQFYCTNCYEQFVTNDHIEYFRKIYRYALAHKDELEKSPKFISCTSIEKEAEYV